MNPGRPGHRLGVTKCDVCDHIIDSHNAVWMISKAHRALRGRCKNCFSHKAGGNDKKKKVYEGNDSLNNPFGGLGKILMR